VWLRETPGTPEKQSPSSHPLREAEALDFAGDRLVCIECGALITFGSERIARNGSHEHEFMNPAGVRFRIGCFASAPGVASVGEVSDVWSWFPGYAWQVVVCRGCIGHVGWSFTRNASGFFGLILDRLREELPPRTTA
jgi:hypothetical protein